MQGNNSVCEKSSEMWLKCNEDAAFHDRNHITSFARCVRVSWGQFIRDQTKWQWANMTNCLHVQLIYSSASFIVFGHGDSELYAIVSSIIYQLSLLSNFEVKFVRRQANMVAHILVRVACSWASRILLVLNIGW